MRHEKDRLRKDGSTPRRVSTIVTLSDRSKVDLEKLAADIASKAGLDTCPRIVLENGAKAHARFNSIRIGRELPSHFTKDEMTGVVAHEFHHVTLGAKLFDAETISWIIFVLAALAFVYVFGITLGTSEIVLIVILSLLYVIPIRRHMSKRAEFEADRFAARMTDVKPFCSALKKYDQMKPKESIVSKLMDVFSPHPSLEDRIKRLAR